MSWMFFSALNASDLFGSRQARKDCLKTSTEVAVIMLGSKAAFNTFLTWLACIIAYSRRIERDPGVRD